MSGQNLPKEITVKFLEDNNIQIIADGNVFPFPVSDFTLTYNPVEGAAYAITAGNSVAPAIPKPEPKKVQAVNNFRPTNVMVPSGTGLLGDDSMDAESPLSIPEITDLLEMFHPERKKVVVKDVPKGFTEYTIKKIETKARILPIPLDADSMELLVQDLANAEKQLFADFAETGEKKYMVITPPTVCYEEDEFVLMEERIRIYQRG